MGDISELIQDGILCSKCGSFVGKDKINSNGGKVESNNEITKSPGYPLKCDECDNKKKHRRVI